VELADRLDILRSDAKDSAGSVWITPAIATLVAVFFTTLRWINIEFGDITRGILVGRDNAPGQVAHVAVFNGAGYDGQFYYRFALDPFKLNGLVNGISVDKPIRWQRVGYSFIAWALSFGHAPLVPYMLVLVNIVSFAAIAATGAMIAKSYGRHPLFGLAFCAFAGTAVTLARDLTELVAAVAILASALALRRGHPVACGLLLSLAVITRETALLLAIALALADGISRGGAWRKRRTATSLCTDDEAARPTRHVLAWALPFICFASWQLLLFARYGVFALGSERTNGSLPGSAVVAAIARWVHSPTGPTTIFLLVSITLGFAVIACIAVGRRAAPAAVIALLLATVLAVSLSTRVWNDDLSEVRTLYDVHVYGVLVLLQAAPRTLLIYSGAAGALTIMTFVHFCSFL